MPRLPCALILLLGTFLTGMSPAFAEADALPSEAALEAGIEAHDAGRAEAAAAHFRRAAELGSDEAAFRLAIMHERGVGVRADIERAVEWYRQAAEAGSEKAQFNLAHLYATGHQIDRDLPAAVRWYRASAEQDNPHAQFALALILFQAEQGVDRDLVEAYKWITLAVLNFDTNHFRDDAASARGHIVDAMSQAQKAEGRRQVDAHRGR